MSEALHMPKAALEELIAILWSEGFKVLGPVARDGAVGFEEVRQVSDLAVAMRDAQQPGRYRLEQGAADEIFGVVNGAGSLKPFFFAPEETLLEIKRERRGFKVSEVDAGGTTARIHRRAGVRPRGACRAGSHFSARPLSRHALPGTAQGCVSGRRQLHPLRADLLLRLDEDRSGGGERVSIFR